MAPSFTADDVVLLEMTIRGNIVLPENRVQYEYELSRMHNAVYHDRAPFFFVLCHDKEDVKNAIAFCTKHGAPISVRSGGHSACGSSCKSGSVVIDTSRMRGLSYDESTQMVTIEPGNTLSDINVGLMRYNRMTPVGVAPPTCIAGLALHGGVGHLTPLYGTSVDQIEAMEIILADGTVKQLDLNSKGEDGELFWAAKGTASILGIVTEFKMRTYEQATVTGGFWIVEDDDNYTHARSLIIKLRDVVSDQEARGDRKLLGSIFAMNFPNEDPVPPKLQGKPCVAVFVAAIGADDAAAEMVAPFCQKEVIIGKPPAVMPFGLWNQVLSPLFLTPQYRAGYWKSVCLKELPDERLERFMDIRAKEMSGEVYGASMVGVEAIGGAGASVPKGGKHSVENLRNFSFTTAAILEYPNTPENNAEAKIFARKLTAVCEDLATASYSNVITAYKDSKEEKQMHDLMFTPENQERLAAVKARVDPGNIFSRSVIDPSKNAGEPMPYSQ